MPTFAEWSEEATRWGIDPSVYGDAEILREDVLAAARGSMIRRCADTCSICRTVNEHSLSCPTRWYR